MRRASTAVSVIALAIFVLAGCSSPVGPSPASDLATGGGSTEPQRLKVGDRPLGADQPVIAPANPAQAGAAQRASDAAEQQLELFFAAWRLVEQEFSDKKATNYQK